MKKQRVFLAINLPDSIKKELLTFQREWANLPVRWTKKDNLHITLDFIGNVDHEEILEICQSARQKAKKCQPFEIELTRICLGPPGRPPRMIWVEGEPSDTLIKLKNDLGKDNYPVFRPHITLARDVKSRPNINKEISLKFLVNSIEVMASFLSRQGPDYTILESIEL